MNLKIQIEQEVGKENYFVVFIMEFHFFENAIKGEIKNEMLETMKEMFEIETISTAKITDTNQFTEIRINTQNTERINRLQKKLEEVFGIDSKAKERNIPEFDFSNINLN